ncbi:MAG: LPS export ABC transporter periplasmic protein LptC [Candidatus Omnitrophica bacterium]|nr:LPS export ABC transporter periplasmic protein LptC [Candidatus Omnitrophota bacterium]MDD5351848.1 LPS export ABC transporter periplasmic protein LptC [Candidatus Omnitrophota bacterium]MDD5550674.1 LPS export ABC transporter periplasmic protein LptC [Candidatus Omnitrophota bacterium]
MKDKSLGRCISVFFILICLGILCLDVAAANNKESDQKMLGFSLSNFGEKNEKIWDMQGDTLEVFGNIANLTNVKANLYGKEDNMVLTADTGSFDRAEGKMHLQDNVVITSDSGAKVMTDTLDWFQKNQVVSTQDKVNIYKDGMTAEGMGAVGHTDLKQISLNKDVQVDINSDSDSQGKMKKTTITCDGPLDVDYQGQTAVFRDNVKSDDGESQLYADKMTAYFDKNTKKIVKVIAEGNVKIVRGQDISYSQQATYDAESQKISLVGNPKIVFYSKQSTTQQITQDIKPETK